MTSDGNNLALFFGRLHPALVHLPIGALLLLAILELLATVPRFKNAASNNSLILGFATTTALITAMSGWLLSQSGGYDTELLRWHKWAGFAVTVGSTLCLLLRRLARLPEYRAALGATVVVVIVAGHLGGSLTHGRGFFTRYAPEPLRSVFQGSRSHATSTVPRTHPMPADPLDRLAFEDIIQPILLQDCARCHGPEKQKSGLRVDTYAALLKGGKDGPALVPGHAGTSHMIERMRQPLDSDDHMPPQDRPQPTREEIALIEWWIDAGARPQVTVRDLKPSSETKRLLNLHAKRAQ
jgi:uncharacterized membrane protein